MAIRLFSSNLDSTLIGSPGASHHFRDTWQSIDESRRPLLVYNSGRLLDDIRQIIDSNQLPMPDYIIGGVGTQLFDTRTGKYLRHYERRLRQGWDLDKIRQIVNELPGVEYQPSNHQNPYKASWYLPNATLDTIHYVRERLKSAGMLMTVVYSDAINLDVIPARTNKALALKWLSQKLDIPVEAVLVTGSAMNDASVYFLDHVKSFIVENAKPELFEAVVALNAYRCNRVMSEGVAEGLEYYGVIDKAPMLSTPLTGPEADRDLKMLFDPDAFTTLNLEDRQFIGLAFDKAVETIRRNITSVGFSAASIEDNEVLGTDENYNSVWSRDGAITIIGTLRLDDPAIRQCQRMTLETLITNISPAGQLPANVRIATRQPDYSGVGGICAIDSNLWLIIAMQQWAAYTGDTDILHQYAGELQRAMNWVSAHDSNNDGLLEIPEASDWTDLFGRSYNVLYDEVLWFRAHICYARILEMIGEQVKAADYHKWAQHIQRRVMHRFWPSHDHGTTEHPTTFADRQYSLGEARYLLAEVTPFNFNWRCDVYGNIIAFLMGLMDVDKARRVFAFMWGCGVNEPYPVANLYPVVQAGDPDWRPYYTVNLLNLPHHYHNGGIWPFIGGMWCRTIHRLGQHAVACRELVRLAKLNQQGMRDEWEFNEWAHGRTGRVLGKRYQAWSASSFIHACYELQLVNESLDG